MDFSKLDENPMARYKPTEPELIQICNEFGVGELLSVHGELGGSFNVNLKMTTSLGQYVCRVHSGLSRKNHLDAQQVIIGKLRQNKVPVLTPLQTKQGASYLVLHHRFVQVTPFVSGVQFQVSLRHPFEMGKTLRMFHDTLSETDGVPVPYWSNYPSDDILTEGVRDLKIQLQEGVHRAELVTEVELLHQMVMERWLDKAKQCKTTIIHGDWQVWNVILNPTGKVEYILDFDGIQRGERIHDIAYFLWSIRYRTDHDAIGRDFMRGYGPISAVEKELLPVAIARSSIFFLCTASFTADSAKELKEQMEVQKPYIQWLLSSDGHQCIRSQANG